LAEEFEVLQEWRDTSSKVEYLKDEVKQLREQKQSQSIRPLEIFNRLIYANVVDVKLIYERAIFLTEDLMEYLKQSLTKYLDISNNVSDDADDLLAIESIIRTIIKAVSLNKKTIIGNFVKAIIYEEGVDLHDLLFPHVEEDFKKLGVAVPTGPRLLTKIFKEGVIPCRLEKVSRSVDVLSHRISLFNSKLHECSVSSVDQNLFYDLFDADLDTREEYYQFRLRVQSDDQYVRDLEHAVQKMLNMQATLDLRIFELKHLHTKLISWIESLIILQPVSKDDDDDDDGESE
jgi:hypothetical protein